MINGNPTYPAFCKQIVSQFKRLSKNCEDPSGEYRRGFPHIWTPASYGRLLLVFSSQYQQAYEVGNEERGQDALYKVAPKPCPLLCSESDSSSEIKLQSSSNDGWCQQANRFNTQGLVVMSRLWSVWHLPASITWGVSCERECSPGRNWQSQRWTWVLISRFWIYVSLSWAVYHYI